MPARYRLPHSPFPSPSHIEPLTTSSPLIFVLLLLFFLCFFSTHKTHFFFFYSYTCMQGGMRYPLRSRTPLSGMKNLGLYIPPPAVRLPTPRPSPIPLVFFIRVCIASRTVFVPLLYFSMSSPRKPVAEKKKKPFAIPPLMKRKLAQRAAAAAVTTANTITNTNTNMNMNTLKAAASIPAPRPRANNVENDAPATNTAAATTTALALPKPITAAAAADKPPAAPLAAICRTAVSSWKRKEGADKPVSSTTSSSSSSRRGSRSRGGRGRSSSVRVVVVPVNR